MCVSYIPFYIITVCQPPGAILCVVEAGSSAGSAAGSHARWLLSSRNLIRLRSALAPGGVLTRALFDALDENGDCVLSREELEKVMEVAEDHAACRTRFSQATWADEWIR